MNNFAYRIFALILLFCCTSSLYSQTSPPVPTNDTRAKAQVLEVNSTADCKKIVSSTTLGATNSFANNSDVGHDVWFQFKATNRSHTISLTKIRHIIKDNLLYQKSIRLDVYLKDTSVVVPLSCLNPNDSLFTYHHFKVGGEYQIRVFDLENWSTSTFDICVKTVPTPVFLANDEPAGAIVLQATDNCTQPTKGTLVGATATPKLLGCFTPSFCSDDVWYKFRATQSNYAIEISHEQDYFTQLEVAVYKDTLGSPPFACPSDYFPYKIISNNFTIGKDYYIRVSKNSYTGKDFTICLKKLPPTPTNDDATGAIALTSSTSTTCNAIKGSTQSSTISTISEGCFEKNNDVWYKFKTTSRSHRIILKNVQSVLTPIYGGSQIKFDVWELNNLGKIVCLGRPDSDSLTYHHFTPNSIYYIRVGTVGSFTEIEGHTFDICVTKSDTPTNLPANDTPATATKLSMNSPNDCKNIAKGSLVDATSPLHNFGCETISSGYSFPKDVWYSFVATATAHEIRLTRLNSVGNYLGFAVFHQDSLSKTTANCNIGTYSDDSFLKYHRFKVGATYYVRVYASEVYNSDFELCVSTLPPAPPNDEFKNATLIEPSSTLSCSSPLKGTLISATASSDNLDNSCGNGLYSDVWYKFRPKSKRQIINVSNAKSATSFPHLLMSIGYLGADGKMYCTDVSNSFSDESTIKGSNFDVTKDYYVWIRNWNKIDDVTFSICVTTPPPPPANDDRCTPLQIPVNPGWTCEKSVSGTTYGAYPTTNFDSKENDVWFYFIPTQTTHTLYINNIVQRNTALQGGLRIQVAGHDTCSLGSPYNFFVEKTVTNADNITLKKLSVGRKYRVRLVNHEASSPFYFDLCVSTPVLKVTNTSPNTAQEIPVNDGLIAEKVVNATTALNGYSSGETIYDSQCGSGYRDDDVWFKFTAKSNYHEIALKNVEEMIYDSGRLAAELWGVQSDGSMRFVACLTNQSAQYEVVKGNLYYINLYSTGRGRIKFTISITTPPLTANDDYKTATRIQADTTSTPKYWQKADFTWANYTKIRENEYKSPDIWYVFTATSTVHKLALKYDANKTAPYGTVFLIPVESAFSATDTYQNFSLSDTSYLLKPLVIGKQYYLRLVAQSTVGRDCTNCQFEIAVITPPFNFPKNDDCVGAIELSVNGNKDCTKSLRFNFKNATRTNSSTKFPEQCPSYAHEIDVWFKFKATNTQHIIKLVDSLNNNFGNYGIFEGNCDGLQAFGCGYNRDASGFYENFKVGTVYYIQVKAGFDLNVSHTLCISTPTNQPVNDECANAITLNINPNLTPTIAQKGNLGYATYNKLTDEYSQNYPDVWYRFKATKTAHIISITNYPIDKSIFYEVRVGDNCQAIVDKAPQPLFSYSAGEKRPLYNLVVGKMYYVRVFNNIYPQNYQPADSPYDISILSFPSTPANDLCANAQILTPSNAANPTFVKGNTIGATPDISHCSHNPESVWYKFTAKQTRYLVQLKNIKTILGTDGACVLSLNETCDNSSPNYQCVDNKSSYVFENLIVDRTYYLRVAHYGYSGSTGYEDEISYDISLQDISSIVPTNSTCATATPLTPSPDTTHRYKIKGNLIAGGLTNSETTRNYCRYQGQHVEVWYTLKATAKAHLLTINNLSAPLSYGTKVEIITAKDCFSTNASFSQCLDLRSETMTLENLSIGTTYYIVVAVQKTEERFSFDISVTTPPIPANDECANAVVLKVGKNTCIEKIKANATFATASIDGTEASFCSAPKDIWFTFDKITDTLTLNFSTNSFNNYAETHSYQLWEDACGKNGRMVTCAYISGNYLQLTGLNPTKKYYLSISNSEQLGAGFEICATQQISTSICDDLPQFFVNPTTKIDSFKNVSLISNEPSLYRFKPTLTSQQLVLKNLKNLPQNHHITINLSNSPNCTPSSINYNSRSFYVPKDTSFTILGLEIGKQYILSFIDNYNYDAKIPVTFTAALTAPPPPPSYDICKNAQNIDVSNTTVCNNPVMFDFSNSTPETKNNIVSNCFDISKYQDVWGKFVATSQRQIITTQSDGYANNIYFEVLSGNCDQLQAIYCGTIYSAAAVHLLSKLEIGKTYYILFSNSEYSPRTTFSCCITTPAPNLPLNDECINAINIPINTGIESKLTVSGQLTYATKSDTKASCQTYRNKDIWFKFKPTATTHRIILRPDSLWKYSHISPNLVIYKGDCGGLSVVECFTIDLFTELYLRNLEVGKDYFIELSDNIGSRFNSGFIMSIVTLPTPPVNDDCSGVLTLPINTNLVPQKTLDCSLANATPGIISYAGFSTTPDVWFKFTATARQHQVYIDLPENMPTTLNGFMGLWLFEKCDTLSNSHGISTQYFGNYLNANNRIKNLTIGKTYWLRVAIDAYSQETILALEKRKIALLTPPIPSNDDCIGAHQLLVGKTCTTPLKGTTVNANGNTEIDANQRTVWYRFIATAAQVKIEVSNIKFDNGYSIYDFAYNLYEGTCANHSLVKASDDYSKEFGISNLKIGQNYLIELHFLTYSGYYGDGEAEFGICAYTPPIRPVNDDITNAIELTVNTGGKCDKITSGTTYLATESKQQGYCGKADDDVWYKFTATDDYHIINLSNIKPVVGENVEMSYQIFGADENNQLQPIGCSKSAYYQTNGWKVIKGKTYYIRVFTDFFSALSYCSFDICVTSRLAYDNPFGAIALDITSRSALCPKSAIGSTDKATFSSEIGLPTSFCQSSNLPKDIWFVSTVPTTIRTNLKYEFVQAPKGSMPALEAFYYTQGTWSTAAIDCQNQTILNPKAGEKLYLRVWDAANATTGMYEICLSQSRTVANEEAFLPEVSAVDVFPNPTNNDISLRIVTERTKNIIWRLVSPLGQVMQQQNVNLLEGENISPISLKNVPNGYYFLQISDIQTGKQLWKVFIKN